MKSSGSNQVEVSTGRNVRMGVSSERRESLDNIRRECAPPRASCLAQRPATRVRSQPAKKAAPGWTILYPQLDHHPLLVYFILPSCQSLSYANPLEPASERSQHPCARSLSPSPRLRPFPLPPSWPRSPSLNAPDLQHWPRAAADRSWASCLAPDVARTLRSPQPATSRPQRHRGRTPRPEHLDHPLLLLLAQAAAPSLNSPALVEIPLT